MDKKFDMIITIAQVLLTPCIVSKDKVIFYDGVVFDIDKIDSIEYMDSSRLKNKKRINISKGFENRKITTKIEDFEKVKSLLENKKILT